MMSFCMVSFYCHVNSYESPVLWCHLFGHFIVCVFNPHHSGIQSTNATGMTAGFYICCYDISVYESRTGLHIYGLRVGQCMTNKRNDTED